MGTLINEFTWSKSRDTLFQECRRAYFFNHYGAWGGWDSSAPAEVRELYLLKNLNTRATWIGIVVHEVAERLVRGLRSGWLWPEEDALTEAEKRMREEVRLSAEGAYRRGARLSWNRRPLKATGFQEHYYQTIDDPAYWESAIDQAMTCIRNLYQTPAIKRLQQLPPDAILSVEDLQSFMVGDVKVWVKLDLAIRGRDGGIVILDWKTGASHREADISLQLGIYALFGMQFWGVDPTLLRGYDVNLRDQESHQHALSHENLVGVERYIQDSASQMRALLDDIPENRASIERFPLTPELASCRSCRFRRVCQRE